MSVIEQLSVRRLEAHPRLEVAVPDRPPQLEPPRSNRLRAILVTSDMLAVVVGWTLPVAVALAGGTVMPPTVILIAALLAPATAMALIAWQRLYLARVCNLRSVEIQRLGRVVAGTAIGVYGAMHIVDAVVPIRVVLTATALSFAGLLLGRTWYRSWLGNQRRVGRFTRRVVLVGANDDAAELHGIIGEHPELGYRIVGVVSPRARAGVVVDVPWLGDYHDLVHVTNVTGANGALIVATALSPGEVNEVSRRLLEAGKHVQLSSGLRGISTKRLKTMSLAYQPLFYVEQAVLSVWQLRLKRAMDVMLAGLGLLLTAPVLGVAAAAIKLEDGGPLLFKQQRIGRDGVPFEVFKLRTMVPDAEKQQDDLAEYNQRDGGPLFKLAADPRVTKVGRLLRASSIDELPQLCNVLRGDMSLVGPRPALAREVEQFDEELRSRTQVLPGITGLWQVEARDNPAFGPYRRLDLFYVENWSVTLDLGILLATVGVVGGRTLRAFGQLLRRQPKPHPAVVLD